MNAVVKIWSDSHSSIYKFVTQFEKMTTSQYEREDFEDFMTKDGDATLWSHDPIEKEARDIYTRTMISEFKIQLKAATGYAVTELEKDSFYKISKFSNPSNPNQIISEYTVSIIKAEGKVLCTCKFFDFYGILCSHALRAMNYAGIHNIPPCYVTKRWTKDAKKGTSSTKMTACDDDSFRRARRFDSLTMMTQNFISKGSKSDGAYEAACKKIQEGILEFTLINKASGSTNEGSIKNSTQNIHEITISRSSELNLLVTDCAIRDPPQSQCKGKRRPQRFKPPVEKKVKKSRTCMQCGKKGHNRRTCHEVDGTALSEKGDSSDSFEGIDQSDAGLL
ncbi:protein FAR-RED IMPAIRED RESPONSE 1-like [Ananas comosus]|uniref:Protein FAR1-RELATED SEQUENCE n=1 Tax=Ananas comosus TaxID=4615 RepID=A0A6P5EL91_ANACO|nr:protein FAR-RED IMPAIRED RESPONSE 1-like [Ananas comosus]